MLDAEGKPDFTRLSARAQIARTSEIQRAAMADAGHVRRVRSARRGRPRPARPAAARSQGAAVERILPRVGPIRYGEHIPEQGEALLAQVVARGLEGVVAKKREFAVSRHALARLAEDEEGSRGRLRGVRVHAAEGHRATGSARCICACGSTIAGCGPARSGAASTTSSSSRSRTSSMPSRPGSRRSRARKARATRAGSSPSSSSRFATASGPRRRRCDFRCSSDCGATRPRSTARCPCAGPGWCKAHPKTSPS